MVFFFLKQSVLYSKVSYNQVFYWWWLTSLPVVSKAFSVILICDQSSWHIKKWPILTSKVYSPNTARLVYPWICCQSHHKMYLQWGTDNSEKHLWSFSFTCISWRNFSDRDVAWRLKASFLLCPLFHYVFYLSVHNVWIPKPEFAFAESYIRLRWRSETELSSLAMCYSSTTHPCEIRLGRRIMKNVGDRFLPLLISHKL